MIGKLAILGIKGYQKYISPKKGFRCAYGVLHNSHGCSGAVINIINEQGLLSGIPSIRKRFNDCKSANEELERRREDKKKCDCGLDEIGGGCLDVVTPNSCDVGNACDCTPDLSCDFGSC